MKFTGSQTQAVPFWLALVYLACNLVLNTLNFYWFGKMIETVRKRFEGKPQVDFPRERERKQSMVELAASELDYDTLSGPKTPYEEKEDQFGQAAAPSKGTEFAKSTAVPAGNLDVRKR
jgi:hypothetical protein